MFLSFAARCLLFLLLWALINSTTHAHAVVTQASLKIAPIAPRTATPVSLIFNSNVEVALSQFHLVSAGDRMTPLTVTSGEKRGEVVVNIPALEPGEYALRFKIFAADGHLTEDLIRFHVKE